MGMNFCCMAERNEIINKNNDNIIKEYIPQKDNIDEKTQKIIKIQSCIRRFLFEKKLKIIIDSKQSQISNELENKKLINETNITECESYIIYSKLISENEISPYLEEIEKNQNYNNIIKNLTKYCFTIPYYIVTSPNEVYKGSWNLYKKYHGHGVKFEFDEKKTKNKRIEGIFMNGFLFGQGLIIFSNGEILKGNFIKNYLNGAGEHIRKDKSRYIGEFRNGKYSGIGQEIFPDESKFEGFFTEGEKKYGKYEWKNGSKYEGEFKNNIFHGKGKYNWSNKKEYDGNWKDGKMNGKGKFIYPDGSYYEGEFLEGKKCGLGKYVWEKERYFDGRWKNDKQNGYGIYHDKDKEIKGLWIDGKIINRNLNNNSIKRNKTYMKEIMKKSRNESPSHQRTSQEFVYKKNNFTDKKLTNTQLNFNPTAGKKNINVNQRNYNYLNLNKFNQNSMYSIESTNSIKNNTNTKRESK